MAIGSREDMKPTREQRLDLIEAGWVYSIHMERQCRVCQNWIANFEDGWYSPKGAAYHSYCILQSSQVKRIFRKAQEASHAL